MLVYWMWDSGYICQVGEYVWKRVRMTLSNRSWVQAFSATTTASRVMKYERLEGSSVQHDSVAGVDSNSMSLTSGSLFKHSAAWQQLF